MKPKKSIMNLDKVAAIGPSLLEYRRNMNIELH